MVIASSSCVNMGKLSFSNKKGSYQTWSIWNRSFKVDACIICFISVFSKKSKRDKKKYGSPVIYGKAYASDKKGKTMQIPALSAAARKQMKKEMAESAKRNYLRVRKRPTKLQIKSNIEFW